MGLGLGLGFGEASPTFCCCNDGGRPDCVAVTKPDAPPCIGGCMGWSGGCSCASYSSAVHWCWGGAELVREM